MKKKIILILLIAIVGSIAYLSFLWTKSRVILAKDLHAEINSKAKASDYIESVKKGKLMEDVEIDTSKAGKVKVSVNIEINGKTIPYEFKVKVSDTKPPEIQVSNSINCLLGQPFEPKKAIRVIDNSGEIIDVNYKGQVKTNKIGDYEIEISAEDESGNKSKKKIKVNVIDINANDDDISFVTSNGFIGKRKDGVTTVDGVLVASKTFTLPVSYGPGDLTDKAAKAWNKMDNAAQKDGIDISIVSGYRSYSTQKSLYNYYIAKDGKEKADSYSARPGHSEHQTGLAVDINSVEDHFEDTAEGKWLNDNAYKYGWILRYVKGKTEITGYIFESWHYRYVGKELAEILYNDGNWITMEEYFGIPSKYAE
ncbi:MAG: DUF5011 domain-containing protein [Clostridiales bacterium]|nr:DUF5011 domain-containing protein [Clostridiales bacterium]